MLRKPNGTHPLLLITGYLRCINFCTEPKFYIRLRGLENKDKGVAYSWLLLHRPIGGSFSLPAVISEKPRLALGLVVTGSDEGRICKDNVSGSETLEYDHVVALL